MNRNAFKSLIFELNTIVYNFGWYGLNFQTISEI